MLVLTRKVGEQIRVGTSVEVVVLKLSRSQVQLGVAAPDSIKILRGELVVSAPDLHAEGTRRLR